MLEVPSQTYNFVAMYFKIFKITLNTCKKKICLLFLIRNEAELLMCDKNVCDFVCISKVDRISCLNTLESFVHKLCDETERHIGLSLLH